MGRKSRGKLERRNQVQPSAAPPSPAFQGSLFRAEYRSGPMPDSEELRAYDQIVPGMAQDLLNQALQQSAHRQKLETRVVNHSIIKSYLGQSFAFLLGVLVIWRSTEAMLQGQPMAGFGGVLIGLGSLLTAFLVGKSGQKKELEKRSGQ